MNSNMEFVNECELISDFVWRGTCLIVFKKIFNNSIKCYESIVRSFRGYSFRQVFVFLFFTVILLPSSMSVPIRGKRSSTDKPEQSEDSPHWVRPCSGNSSTTQKHLLQEDLNTESDLEIINSVLYSTKSALFQAEKFREEYIWKTFNSQISEHVNVFKGFQYSWLIENFKMPKELGVKIPKEHLETLELEEESMNMFGYLQRVAVAFEQVIHDHRDTDFKFKQEFAEAEFLLKSVLCELREFIPESKFVMFEDARRDIMTPEYRHMNESTHRNVRDWLIFRDYMNLLEYIIEVMEYFKTKIV